MVSHNTGRGKLKEQRPMSEELRQALLRRQALRSIEDLLYVLENGTVPPHEWRYEYACDKPAQSPAQAAV